MEKGLSKSEHIKALASELLDDIELVRLGSEQLILKTQRLARLQENVDVQKWLKYEMYGYNSTDLISILYMGHTGRYTDREKNLGWWGPLSEIEGMIKSNTLMMQTIRIPDISYSVSSSNPYQMIQAYHPDNTVNNLINNAANARNVLNQLSGIRSRVLGLLHTYITTVYLQTEFSGFSETIFEKFKNNVDVKLAEQCKEALDKIPAINDRLIEGDQEAISQALNTCRRIIDSFADAVFPASDSPFDLGGQQLAVDQAKTQNRINAYIYQNCSSASRRSKLRQTLNNLYDRVSTGVHQDVSLEEAKILFLETYIFLGEVITL